MSQRGSTLRQVKANMDLKIIEKPLFFLGFFNTLRKSLEALGNALGDPLGAPWGAREDAWGGLGDALGGLGDALGGLGGALGSLGAALGDPLEDLLGGPWKNLRRTSFMERPESTLLPKTLSRINFYIYLFIYFLYLFFWSWKH